MTITLHDRQSHGRIMETLILPPYDGQRPVVPVNEMIGLLRARPRRAHTADAWPM